MEPNSDCKIFIQANKSQRLGALLGKYSIERVSPGIPVEIMQVEDIPEFQEFEGKTYMHGSEERTYSLADEQSFTLTRFMPPELMQYRGRAVVIDPDVFAVQDIRPLFSMKMPDAAIACRKHPEKKFWSSSVMLLENAKLDWNISNILERLSKKEIHYTFALRYLFDETVTELSAVWNDLDKLTPETRFIHYTRQRTQPWKTGLPFSVTPRKLGRAFGLIPREWLPAGKAKYPETYQEHPNKDARDFFFNLVRDALDAGAIDTAYIEKEIAEQRIRPDILSVIKTTQ